MKKILISLSIIGIVGAMAIGATMSYFSDTETSSGNTFTAGAIDLGIDNESYYNGQFNEGTSWNLTYNLDDGNGPAHYIEGTPTGKYLFFNFLDLKPGDWGEDTISVHVKNNDAWACMSLDMTASNENSSTEPELKDEVPYTPVEGELDKFVSFVWWADDGDNVLEADEAESKRFRTGKLSEINDFSIALADSTGQGVLSEGALQGDASYYIGKAWCFGDFAMAPVAQDGVGKTEPSTNGPIQRGPGITCSGVSVDNSAQTDSVLGNIVFTAIQSRNNPNYKCGGSIGCLGKADVMLVLDRSGSIAGNMSTLKNAAKAFVNALAPSADGVHVGMVSFADTATLNAHLTGNGAAVNSAIDAIGSSGFTNLQHGIKLARLELGNPGDGDDRADVDSPDVIVVITDGEPNRCGDAGNGCSTPAAQAEAKAQADLAKAASGEIYGVGVGITPANAAFMQNDIVSIPSSSHYFDAANFNALEAILKNLATCNAG